MSEGGWFWRSLDFLVRAEPFLAVLNNFFHSGRTAIPGFSTLHTSATVYALHRALSHLVRPWCELDVSLVRTLDLSGTKGQTTTATMAVPKALVSLLLATAPATASTHEVCVAGMCRTSLGSGTNKKVHL